MSKEPFKIGIIGTGMITRASHLPAVLASPYVKLHALVDPVQERAERLAGEFGIGPRIVASATDMLDEVDGAILATPNHTHCALALECIAAGKPVLIEKPLALNEAEGRRIAEAASEAGVTVAVAYTTRFFDSARLMESLLAEGYFGRVKRFVYQYGTPGGWAPMSSYNLSREQSGGGVLVVTATHFLDRMLAWFGYPDEFEYHDDSLGGPEANCWGRFGFQRSEGSIEGYMRLSKTLPIPGGIVFDTEAGLVRLAEPPASPIRFRPAGRADLEHQIAPTTDLETDRKAAGQVQLENFIAACAGPGEPLVDAVRGTESLKLIEALYACRQPIHNDVYREGTVEGTR